MTHKRFQHSVSLGIPTVNILVDDKLRDVRQICGGYPLACMGLSQEVHSEVELVAVLHNNQKLVNVEKARNFLGLDGKSTDRVIEALLK